MEGIRFSDVLQSFEKKTEEDEYKSLRRDDDERKVIENDIRRTALLGVDKTKHKVVKVLKRTLFDVLDKIPVKYTQGMSEIASVFVLYYFLDVVEDEVTKGMLGDGASESPQTEVGGSSEQFISAPEAEGIEFKSFVSRHKDRAAKLGVVLTNVFRRKLEPLVADDFRLYKQNMKVFVEMMRRRGVRIPELESHRFMGSILTFFLRSLPKIEDVHKVFEIILSCPNTCPFLLLVEFYSRVSSNRPIESIGDDLFPKVVKLEEEFIETEKKIEAEGSGFSMKSIMLAGGVASLVAAVLIYRMTKKE